MKRKLSAFLVIAFSVALAGCKDNYGACEKAAVDIGSGISAGMKTVDALRVAGKITPQEESNVLGYLKFANDANGAFASCAQQVHTSGAKTGYTACLTTFQTTLSNSEELGLLHVNPNAQQDIQLIVNGISTGISSLLAALGGS
jgi:hypothetical protein